MKDPAVRAKISAARRARYAADPDALAAARETMATARAARQRKPGFNLTPAVRARGAAVRLAWCPPELRDDYRVLRRKKYTLAEAKAIIATQHEADMARWRRSIGAA